LQNLPQRHAEFDKMQQGNWLLFYQKTVIIRAELFAIIKQKLLKNEYMELKQYWKLNSRASKLIYVEIVFVNKLEDKIIKKKKKIKHLAYR
jgi:hypothetical protein